MSYCYREQSYGYNGGVVLTRYPVAIIDRVVQYHPLFWLSKLSKLFHLYSLSIVAWDYRYVKTWFVIQEKL